ncbi:hypothetical protein OE88DRAFT_1276555 [Heliocybe sulcata]|uniref:Glucose receptor Git3 N-terminal domain-containing protein n=1 Tax=Heliocybe sulcata TaxID=5364 RepID=A0A5C3N8Q5_9AGAM|nr:hypothetical protein OE88DRAFT_1276555 [Heliocybe sulcata]
MENTDGIICSSADLEQSRMSTGDIQLHCLTRGQTIGLTSAILATFISLAAMLVLFVLILRNTMRGGRCHDTYKHLLQLPIDVYVLSLLAFGLVQITAGAIDIKWIYEGKVYVGPYCTAQGSMHEIGEAGIAITTLVIDVHTFCAIWWQKIYPSSVRAATIIMSCTWAFACLFPIINVIVSARSDQYWDSPTPSWCWVSGRYMIQRMMEAISHWTDDIGGSSACTLF